MRVPGRGGGRIPQQSCVIGKHEKPEQVRSVLKTFDCVTKCPVNTGAFQFVTYPVTQSM